MLFVTSRPACLSCNNCHDNPMRDTHVTQHLSHHKANQKHWNSTFINMIFKNTQCAMNGTQH